MFNAHLRRMEKWLENSKKLSKKYFMSESIFIKMVNAGINPKQHIGAIEFKVKGEI